MAGIKAPIQDILQRLSSIQVTNNDGNTVLLYARIWNNQIETEIQGDSYVYPKPAAFLEIVAPVVFNEIGQNFLAADLNINIHLVHEYYNEDGTFEQNLPVFDLRDKVIEALSQYKPTACGQMVCTGEQQDYDHDNIYHYQISFVCHFIDSKASPYDPARGIIIEKEPPTDLDLQVTVSDQPVFNPIQQQYKIPQ